MFVSKYLCEHKFSAMIPLETQHRGRNSDNNLTNSLRIYVSNKIHPDFKDMIKSKRTKKLTIKRETARQVKPLANNKYINTPAHVDSRALPAVPHGYDDDMNVDITGLHHILEYYLHCPIAREVRAV
ncbi:hypothetical protein C0J52_23373 [Blattella germanica]|nr:hypothetical protein C0J52_23373 [Blattella germanica]